MPADRDQTLTHLQRTADTRGSSLDEVDRRVATELGVDVEQYFAFLAVSQALDQYTTVRVPEQAIVSVPCDDKSNPLGRAQDAIAAIGWRAATIYQATATGCVEEVSHHAAGILGSLLQLRQNLRDLDGLEQLARGVADDSSRGLGRDV